jgi:hypothetical protein
MSELLDTVLSHRAAASTYHDHKEQTAYAVTTLYLTGAVVWLVSDSLWDSLSTRKAGWFLAGTVVVAILVLLFINWQLRKRRAAAVIEAACINLSSRIVSGASGLAVHPEEWGGVQWPAALVVELRKANCTIPSQTRPSEYITYAAIILGTLALVWRLIVCGGLVRAMMCS